MVARDWLGKISLVGFLYLGKGRSLTRAADMASPPGWVWQLERCAPPSGTGEAWPGREACEDGPGFGGEAPAGPDAARGARPLKRGPGFRRHRIRRGVRRRIRRTSSACDRWPGSADATPFTSLSLRPRSAPWPGPRVVVIVIILVFIAWMARLGYAPAAALGIVVAATYLADDPKTAWAVLGA